MYISPPDVKSFPSPFCCQLDAVKARMPVSFAARPQSPAKFM
jgi:hypothetical protein